MHPAGNTDTAEILAAFDRQLRRDPPLEYRDDRLERTAHTVRYLGSHGWSGIVWSDLGAADDPLAVIRAEMEFLKRRKGIAEWKHYSHDLPAELPDLLRAAGMTAAAEEALMVAEIAEPARATHTIEREVTVTEVTDEAGARAMVAVHDEVFGSTGAVTVDGLLDGIRAGAMVGLLALINGCAAGAARVEFPGNSEFAGLWGGGTVRRFRGRGVYRALVARRVELAARRGYRYLYSDCTPDSEPILRRDGFVRLSTTTPFTP
jgi:hypothetical protein